MDSSSKPSWPSWITPELVADTLEVWQPYYQQRLTESDAVDILSAVGRLHDILTGSTP